VLSYNLFWWHLFGIQGGAGGSAGKLISQAGHPPFDFVGFQECEDPSRVMTDAGLAADYKMHQGEHAICLGYRHAAWKLIGHGQEDVAEDQPLQYFGRRSAQWMRLRHNETGKFVLFVNHHGPLPLNSGGVCGGAATAHKILKMIAEHGKDGDAIILVGDFNQAPESQTGLELQAKLMKAYSGVFMGGIDNIFTNVKPPYVSTSNLGPGGSDHDAIGAVLQLGPPLPPPPPKPAAPPAKPHPQNLGKCSCNCAWAEKPNGCTKGDDGSCCWHQCCPHDGKPAGVAVHVLQ